MAGKRKKGGGRKAGDHSAGLTPLQRAMLTEAERELTIRVDGKEQKIKVYTGVARKICSVAIGGSPHALSRSMTEMNEAQRLYQQQVDDAVDFAERWKDYQSILLERARERDEDPNTVLPHPDEIEIMHGKGYRVDGPADQAELDIVLANCACRDLYLLQAVLEGRLGKSTKTATDPSVDQDRLGLTPLVLAQFYNEGLPERFHKSDTQMALEMSKYERLTKRELLKQAKAAWQAVGKPRPRGWVMPSLDRTGAELERALQAALDLVADIRSDKLTRDRDIAERIRGMTRQVQMASAQ